MPPFARLIRVALLYGFAFISIAHSAVLAQTPTATHQIGRHCELRNRGIRVHYQLKTTRTPQISDREKQAIEKGLHGKILQGVALSEGAISIKGLSYRVESFAKNDVAREFLGGDHTISTLTPDRVENYSEEAGEVTAYLDAPQEINSAFGLEAALVLRLRNGREPLTAKEVQAMKAVDSKMGAITTLVKEEGDWSHKILFDANFGNFPVRQESTYKGRLRFLVVNEDFRMVKGEWLPFRCTTQVPDSKTGLPNAIEEYRIDSYTIGDLPKSEFSISFPKGTELFDARNDRSEIVK